MRRRRQALQKVVRELDAFPKVQEDCQKPTLRGGTFSLLSLALIVVLIVSEFFYYRSTEHVFQYSVDTEMDSKMLLSFDISVAMPCQYLGADLVDLAGEGLVLSDTVKMEAAAFDLSPNQWRWFEDKRRTLDGYAESRSLSDLPVFRGISMPPRDRRGGEKTPDPPGGCRLHGNFPVKKVTGNFHITSGRSIPHPQGHAHINLAVPSNLLNYSHRIDHFSFGPPVPGVVNPLDVTLKISPDKQHMFQYYLRIVPTKFKTLTHSLDTYQYAVTERNRTKGGHGLPGLFFKYDLTPMVVQITERRHSLIQFFIRLIGIVGGIFSTSGMLNSFIGTVMDYVTCSRKE